MTDSRTPTLRFESLPMPSLVDLLRAGTRAVFRDEEQCEWPSPYPQEPRQTIGNDNTGTRMTALEAILQGALDAVKDSDLLEEENVQNSIGAES